MSWGSFIKNNPNSDISKFWNNIIEKINGVSDISLDTNNRTPTPKEVSRALCSCCGIAYDNNENSLSYHMKNIASSIRTMRDGYDPEYAPTEIEELFSLENIADAFENGNSDEYNPIFIYKCDKNSNIKYFYNSYKAEEVNHPKHIDTITCPTCNMEYDEYCCGNTHTCEQCSYCGSNEHSSTDCTYWTTCENGHRYNTNDNEYCPDCAEQGNIVYECVYGGCTFSGTKSELNEHYEQNPAHNPDSGSDITYYAVCENCGTGYTENEFENLDKDTNWDKICTNCKKPVIKQ